MVWLSAGRVMYGNLLAKFIVFKCMRYDERKNRIFRAVHASYLEMVGNEIEKPLCVFTEIFFSRISPRSRKIRTAVLANVGSILVLSID